MAPEVRQPDAGGCVTGFLIGFALFVVLMIGGAVSGEKTLTRRLAVATDILTFSVVTRRYGVTISSWCRLQQLAGTEGSKFGRALAWALDHIQKDHCAQAVQADIERAEAAMQFLAGADLAHRLSLWEQSLKK